MKLDATTRGIIQALLDDPTAEIQMFRSMHQTGKDAEDTSAEFTPGKGRTVVIKVEGGANNVEIVRVKTEDDEASDGGR